MKSKFLTVLRHVDSGKAIPSACRVIPKIFQKLQACIGSHSVMGRLLKFPCEKRAAREMETAREMEPAKHLKYKYIYICMHFFMHIHMSEHVKTINSKHSRLHSQYSTSPSISMTQFEFVLCASVVTQEETAEAFF